MEQQIISTKQQAIILNKQEIIVTHKPHQKWMSKWYHKDTKWTIFRMPFVDWQLIVLKCIMDSTYKCHRYPHCNNSGRHMCIQSNYWLMVNRNRCSSMGWCHRDSQLWKTDDHYVTSATYLQPPEYTTNINILYVIHKSQHWYTCIS